MIGMSNAFVIAGSELGKYNGLLNRGSPGVKMFRQVVIKGDTLRTLMPAWVSYVSATKYYYIQGWASDTGTYVLGESVDEDSTLISKLVLIAGCPKGGKGSLGGSPNGEGVGGGKSTPVLYIPLASIASVVKPANFKVVMASGSTNFAVITGLGDPASITLTGNPGPDGTTRTEGLDGEDGPFMVPFRKVDKELQWDSLHGYSGGYGPGAGGAGGIADGSDTPGLAPVYAGVLFIYELKDV